MRSNGGMKPTGNSPESEPAAFGTPYRAILDHCRLHEIHHQSFPEDQAVRFSVRGETAIYVCTLRASHSDEVLQVRVEYPVVAGTPALLAQAAEFVARANCGMVIGRLDLDMEGGALAVHIGHVIGAEGVTEEILAPFMGAAIGTAERYFPGLMRMMFGGHTPADAIYLCELDTEGAAKSADSESADKRGTGRKRKSRARRATKPEQQQGAPGAADDNASRRTESTDDPA